VQNNLLCIANALLACGYASQIETCGDRGTGEALSAALEEMRRALNIGRQPARCRKYSEEFPEMRAAALFF
jgi:hypothetical protein